MVKLGWPGSETEPNADVRPLYTSASFLLDLEGRKVLAISVPRNIAKEISGQASAMRTLARLKARIMRGGSGNGQEWLILTNMQNPLLKDYERFGGLVAQGLTNAIGMPVTTSNLAISGTSPISRIETQPASPVTLSNEV